MSWRLRVRFDARSVVSGREHAVARSGPAAHWPSRFARQVMVPSLLSMHDGTSGP